MSMLTATRRALLSADAAEPSSLLTGLVAYWKLEEASGTREDAVGSSDLADNNTVTSETGKLGDAALFAVANTEYLSIADNAALSMGDIDFHIACWVRLASKPAGAVQAFVDKYLSAGNERAYSLDYYQTTDRFRVHISSDGASGTYHTTSATNFGAPSTATWYLVETWYNATTNLLYIAVNNGTPNSVSHTGGAKDGSAGFCIGASQEGGTNHMDGDIDEVAIWKRVLTQAERDELWNGGAGVSYPF